MVLGILRLGTQSAFVGSAIRMMRSPSVPNPLASAIESNQPPWHAGHDRRRSPRAPLRWTLYLRWDGSSHPFRTEARDISKDGFYCVVDQAVRAGERIQCDIVVPTHSFEDPDGVMYLRCLAQAVRVEQIGAGPEFGLACRIEDYCVIHGEHKAIRVRHAGEII